MGAAGIICIATIPAFAGTSLGGTALTTKTDGTTLTHQNYYAYGRKRGSGAMTTDRQYTGQQKDKTGLYYYNAHYYDPGLGQFVSPDTIVPNPTTVHSYNRYMYTFGNPLKYNDPSGHNCGLSLAGSGMMMQSPCDLGGLIDAAIVTTVVVGGLTTVGMVVEDANDLVNNLGGFVPVPNEPTVLSDPSVGQPASRTTLVPQDDGSYTGGFMTTDLPGIQTTGDYDSAGVGELMGSNVFNSDDYYRKGQPYSRSELENDGAINTRTDRGQNKSGGFIDYIRAKGGSFRAREWEYVMETWEYPDGEELENH